MRLSRVIFVFLIAVQCAVAQVKVSFLDSILSTTPLMQKVQQSKGKYQAQIIYTKITRAKDGTPSFKNYNWNVDTGRYFYCASLVKLPISIFALEKLSALNIKGLDRKTTMLTDSTGPCQVNAWTDSTSKSGKPSVEHYIHRMLLISDNFAYSRMFEFVTPSLAQKRMNELGYPNARIIHRFDVGCIGSGNRKMNRIRFVDDQGNLIYTQESDTVTEEWKQPVRKMIVGRDIYNKKKKLLSSKKDFRQSNFLPLPAIHNIVKNLVFFDSTSAKRPFKISGDDRRMLLTLMGMLPRESEYPAYPSPAYPDALKKYFIYGANVPRIEADSVRIFNIVGRAYGYLSDCAYIVDPAKGIEFLLSVVIFTNERNSFGSGKYEYDRVGLPFLKELSLALYRFESTRQKKFLPDLSVFNYYNTLK